jgi:hypothetical protein
MESGGREFGAFGKRVFAHLIQFINTLYKLYTFDAICKDNTAIKFITV